MHDRKQADYGREGDAFANVRASEDFGIPGWIGCLTRANDKMKRLQKAASGAELRNESIEDSLLDLATYTVIALVLFREERARSSISLEPVRTLLAPDYPDRPHPSDPLKTEPEDWHVLEHGGPDA